MDRLLGARSQDFHNGTGFVNLVCGGEGGDIKMTAHIVAGLVAEHGFKVVTEGQEMNTEEDGDMGFEMLYSPVWYEKKVSPSVF